MSTSVLKWKGTTHFKLCRKLFDNQSAVFVFYEAHTQIMVHRFFKNYFTIKAMLGLKIINNSKSI